MIQIPLSPALIVFIVTIIIILLVAVYAALVQSSKISENEIQTLDELREAIQKQTENLKVEEKLTRSEKEIIYREIKLEYAIEDAERQVEEWMDEHEGTELYREITDDDYKQLAKCFMNDHECNIADNMQWQVLITNYFEEMNIIHPDLNP